MLGDSSRRFLADGAQRVEGPLTFVPEEQAAPIRKPQSFFLKAVDRVAPALMMVTATISALFAIPMAAFAGFRKTEVVAAHLFELFRWPYLVALGYSLLYVGARWLINRLRKQRNR